MQTKFDVDEIVYVPMKVLCIGINYADSLPDYRLRPIWKGNEEFDIVAPEPQILNKEDIINGKAEDNGHS